MCHEKLDEGQTPACVQACPGGAIEIESVNVEQWLKEDMAKEGVAPHLPDISITKPTTRYTLQAYQGEVKPADEHLLKPAHAELPLVFMTVLTQVSVGGFLALFFGSVLHYFGFNLFAPNFWLALAVFIPAGLGLPLSALHLGRPIMALTAMKNIKTSWLSREAAALGAYAGGATLVAGLYFMEIEGFIMIALQAGVLLIGIVGIYSQAKIYRIRARPSWDRSSTDKKFFGAGYVGFLLTAFVMLLQGADRSVMAILALTLLFGAYQMFVIFEENTFYKYLSEDEKNYYQLSRTKRLLEERFGNLKKVRLMTLGIFALLFPLSAIIMTASGMLGVASVLLGVGLVGALVSELVGRYLFFRSVVPLGLAGNFFAGNQR
jgi:DMSO reductase anchor subunit